MSKKPLTEQPISTKVKGAYCETCKKPQQHLVQEYGDYWLYWCYLNCGDAFTVRKKKNK